MDSFVPRSVANIGGGAAHGPLPSARAAGDANLVVARSEAMLGMHRAMADRMASVIQGSTAPRGIADRFDAGDAEVAPGADMFEPSGDAAEAAPPPAEQALVGRMRLQPDVLTRSSRPQAAEAQAEEAASPLVDPQEFATLAEGIVPFAMESLLNRAHRDDHARKRDAAKFVLLMLKAHGAYVYEHCTRLVDLAMALSKELGIEDEQTHREVEDGLIYRDVGEVAFFLTRQSPRQREALAAYLEGVEMAQDSLLHDIGKIQVPPEILYKPGQLTPREMEIMRMHPVWGAEILSNIPPLVHAVPSTRHHHERWDGTGYPGQLKGPDTPLAARIVTVVDTFDALVSDRPYRKALPYDEVLEIMREGVGTQFDPDIGASFLRIVDRVWSPDRQY